MDMIALADHRLFSRTYAGTRVLITGHTGFKGSWLTSWLKMLGAEVCGYSIGVPTDPSLFNSAGLEHQIRHELGDIRDISRLQSVVSDFRPDFIFHLAAQAIVSTSYVAPIETLSVNIMGTANVLETLRSLNHSCAVIIVTSDKAYDNVEWPWGYREVDRLGGKDVYSGSKGAAELVFNCYKHSFFNIPGHAVRLASARAGNVIGGGDWAQDRIVADCVRAWVGGDRVQIRSPNATRPWQHVLEPLSGYLLLGARLKADENLHGESFNFGPRGEQNATVLELLSSLAEVWGFDDLDRAYGKIGDAPFQESSLLKLNTDKALLMLAWQPTLSYSECVTLTAEWYRDVCKSGMRSIEITEAQIRNYQEVALSRKCFWAQ